MEAKRYVLRPTQQIHLSTTSSKEVNLGTEADNIQEAANEGMDTSHQTTEVDMRAASRAEGATWEAEAGEAETKVPHSALAEYTHLHSTHTKLTDPIRPSMTPMEVLTCGGLQTITAAKALDFPSRQPNKQA